MITMLHPTKEPRVTAKPEGSFDAGLTDEGKEKKNSSVTANETQSEAERRA